MYSMPMPQRIRNPRRGPISSIGALLLQVVALFFLAYLFTPAPAHAASKASSTATQTSLSPSNDNGQAKGKQAPSPAASSPSPQLPSEPVSITTSTGKPAPPPSPVPPLASPSTTATVVNVVTFTQEPFDPSYPVGVGMDGGPSSIDGRDHDVLGNLKFDQQGKNKPAVGMNKVDEGFVNSGPNIARPYIKLVTPHNEETQAPGGLTNALPTSDASLDAFVQSAKQNPDYKIDLSAQIPVNMYGSANDYKVVYAYNSDLAHEKPFHKEASFEGYGVLILEVNDPKFGGLILNSGARWTGLVIVVANYRDDNPSNNGNLQSVIDLRGSGTKPGGQIVGAAIAYLYNQRKSANDVIFGHTWANTSGGGKITYSSDALSNVRIKVKSAFQVRSWKRIDS